MCRLHPKTMVQADTKGSRPLSLGQMSQEVTFNYDVGAAQATTACKVVCHLVCSVSYFKFTRKYVRCHDVADVPAIVRGRHQPVHIFGGHHHVHRSPSWRRLSAPPPKRGGGTESGSNNAARARSADSTKAIGVASEVTCTTAWLRHVTLYRIYDS